MPGHSRKNEGPSPDPGNFMFRSIHPLVRLGTASDRYAGWTGQIYTSGLYEDRITRRKKTVGGRSFTEEVLPVDSVREYFRHFGVLEIDSTFYMTLLDRDGRTTRNHHLLRAYSEHIQEEDRLILKVPQSIIAPRVPAGGKYIENPEYLDAESFTRRFYDPAVEILGPALGGFVFEQSYQRKEERLGIEKTADLLDEFFSAVPHDDRYHVELRTCALLGARIFSVFEKHGVGQILSHWTWLPALMEQFEKSGRSFFNSGRQAVIRLLTPRGKSYEDTYIEAFPFDRLLDGMLSSHMVDETARLMRIAVERGVSINVIVNNRSGGNAPLVAREIVGRFLLAESS